MKRKTDWYRGDQKPLADRPGVYSRRYPSMKNSASFNYYYCWWDGANFGIAFPTTESCDRAQLLSEVSLYQNLPWRGITKD